MTRTEAEDIVCQALLLGPRTTAELLPLIACSLSTLESAIRLLKADGVIQVASVRSHRRGRAAQVYALAEVR